MYPDGPSAQPSASARMTLARAMAAASADGKEDQAGDDGGYGAPAMTSAGLWSPSWTLEQPISSGG